MKKAIITLAIIIILFALWIALSPKETNIPDSDNESDKPIPQDEQGLSENRASLNEKVELEGLDFSDIEAEFEAIERL